MDTYYKICIIRTQTFLYQPKMWSSVITKWSVKYYILYLYLSRDDLIFCHGIWPTSWSLPVTMSSLPHILYVVIIVLAYIYRLVVYMESMGKHLWLVQQIVIIDIYYSYLFVLEYIIIGMFWCSIVLALLYSSPEVANLVDFFVQL